MLSKQKVLNAINYKQGKVALDLGAFPTTGIHVSVMEKLRDHYGLKKCIPKVLEPYQMLGMVEDDLRAAIGSDAAPFWGRMTMFGFENKDWKEFITPWGQTVLLPDKFITTEKQDKIYLYAKGNTNYPPSAEMPKSSFFFDSICRQNHFDEDNLNADDNLEEFGHISEKDIVYYRNLAEENKDCPYLLGANFGGTALGDIALVPAPGLEDPKGIRDVSEWYMSTLIRPDYLHEIFEKQVEIALDNLKKIYDIVGNLVSVAYICGNDFGTQNAPFCSSDTFKSLYGPHYRKINDWVHANTEWKTFKHSCGAIEPLIPELIDVGFDIINPVQWTADGMDAKKLKEKYGRDIVFWGGGIDTQNVLPFGKPEQVREQTLKMCEIFAKDGGFVFNTIHNIQAMTPIENITAMYEAIKEFNGDR